MFNLVVYLVALIAHVHPTTSGGSNKRSVTDSAQGFGKVIKLKADLRAAFLKRPYVTIGREMTHPMAYDLKAKTPPA